VSFVGNYDPVTLTANDNTVLYLGAGNQLYYPSAAMSINAFRAYFQLNGITAGEPKNIRLFFGDADKDTGIRPLSGSPEGEGAEAFPREGLDGVWFTLDGRKLQGRPTKKGVYIYRSTSGRLQGKNGKKRVIK
jgi:hypothetical protein